MKNAPTLVPVEDGGAPVRAKILVLDTSEEEATNRLYRRETRNPDPDCVYTAPKNPGPNQSLSGSRTSRASISCSTRPSGL